MNDQAPKLEATSTPTLANVQPPASRPGRGKRLTLTPYTAVMVIVLALSARELMTSIVNFMQSLSSDGLVGGVDTIGWAIDAAFWGVGISLFARRALISRGKVWPLRCASVTFVASALVCCGGSLVAGSLAAFAGGNSEALFKHLAVAFISALVVVIEFGADGVRDRMRQV
jgi:hypothetical protein